ncbi:MAG: hypothetical protein U1E23_03560 [Reyranellaceae bacterium]
MASRRPRSIARPRPTPSERAEAAQARRLRTLVARRARPRGYDRFELEFTEDSMGDPAIYVWFTVEDDLNPSKEKIASVNALVHDVTQALLDSGDGRFPYVQFRVAS